MIECIFTIDYEIYGNGEGSLRELVYEPAQKLIAVFNRWNARFVSFVEAAEFQMIEKAGTDSGINLVKEQIQEFHKEGFEIGLHLHPQWYNARYERGKWILDYSEYNLCTLSRDRIDTLVQRAMDYLREILGRPDFTPISFRAGNWLFQPTKDAAAVLARKGIRLDSSVFKGGVQRRHRLDYRPALKNGYYWRFQDNANLADPEGQLLEVPTYSAMVPSWRMITKKRVALQQKSPSTALSARDKLNRVLDLLRPWYPLKFDFCRMTFDELKGMMDEAISEDSSSPDQYRPLVAIGHTKDLTDFETVERFLSFLNDAGISIKTLQDCHDRIVTQANVPAAVY